MINENDNKILRCPMLGHEVTFSYCRSTGQNVPCRKIFDCWWQIFDIKSYMQENFPEETLQKITEQPKPKMLTLFELIEQAKERARRSNCN